MSVRELPFGARIEDSFVKKLKWDSVKALDESPGVVPCLCTEERQRQVRTERQTERINFEERSAIPAVNRLAPPAPSRAVVVKERAWVLRFEKRMTLVQRLAAAVSPGRKRPKTTFEIDGLELHVSEQAQAELKGSTVRVVNDKILVSYDHI